MYHIISVQSLNLVWLFAATWTVAHQASLSITNPWSLLQLKSIESMMPSNHFISSYLLLPSFNLSQHQGLFQMSQLFASGGQILVSASTSLCPGNIQDWFPLGWTVWISLLSKGLLKVFSNTTVQQHQFFGTQLSSQSNSHIHTWQMHIEDTVYMYICVCLYTQ